MPLFASKKRYHLGDVVVVSSLMLYEHSYGMCDINRLDIFIGHFDPIQSRSRGKMPAVTPYWELSCYLNGERRLLDVYDTEAIVITTETIEGVVCGRLDYGDYYDAKSYLKQCARILFPIYRDAIMTKAMSHIE